MGMPTGPEGLDKLLGFDYVEAGPDRVEIRFEVRPELLQPFGIVHGGVHSAVVESAASIGAALWYGEGGQVVGVANHTNFLRAVGAGTTLTAVATPIQRGRTQQLWLVEVSDDGGRAIARGEVRLANLPPSDRTGKGR
ncbi:MAG: PaaI family thioesterase [Frankiaceae bacterium]